MNMLWFRNALLFLTALPVAGCATTAQFRATLDEFLGMPISAAQEAFGYGYTMRDLDEGGSAYTWKTVRAGMTPGYETPTQIHSDRLGDRTKSVTVYPGTYYPPEVYRELCEFTFITDPSGKILRWNAQGEGCRGQPGGPVLRSEEGRAG